MSENAANLQEQRDEICVLSSIFREEEFVAIEDLSGGKLFACVTLPPDFVISYKRFGESNQLINVPISHLPPVTLTFKYPSNYPSEEKPEFEISCLWLSVTKLNKVCEKLDKLWEENKGTVVLFQWSQFLKGELMAFLGLTKNLDLCRQYSMELKRRGILYAKSLRGVPSELDITRETTSGDKREPKIQSKYKVNRDPRIVTIPLVDTHLHEYLISFNEDMSKTEFLRTLFTCDICFEDFLGEKCVQFKPCDDVFCKECLRKYFEERIQSGNVHTMPCPRDKCKSEAQQHQIKELLGSLLYLKYDKLLLNATLDTMADITYCPRTSCVCPVLKETEDKMAICPKCNYIFCVHCRMTYHGVERCKLKTEKILKILEEYNNGDAKAKAHLEKLYGKKEIMSYIEAAKSEEWIKQNSKLCPNCEAAIEKFDGCNKMECTKCKAYFCWICLQVLDRGQPYDHFNNPLSKCHNQLYQGVDLGEIDEHFLDNLLQDLPDMVNQAFREYWAEEVDFSDDEVEIEFNLNPGLYL